MRQSAVHAFRWHWVPVLACAGASTVLGQRIVVEGELPARFSTWMSRRTTARFAASRPATLLPGPHLAAWAN